MKTIWKLLIIVFAIILGTGFFIVSKKCNRVYVNEKEEIRVKTNQEFSIVLVSNQTTGYSWNIAKPLNKNILELLEEKYVSPKTSRLGVSGKQVFKFRAVGKGETTIYLEYIRSWENNSLENRVFKVKVD
jgi:inhibitor of cysteine peptidase